MPRAEPGAASELRPLLGPDGGPNNGSDCGELRQAGSLDSTRHTPSSASANWPLRLYYFMFTALILLQTLRAVGTDWHKRDDSGCEPIWWAMCLRYLPILTAALVHLLGWCWNKSEQRAKAHGNATWRATWKGAWKFGPTVTMCRVFSTATIFYTGMAKFDFGHCGFFTLGLWLALVGIRSHQSLHWMSHLCKLLMFFVYCMNFPWIDEPGMWTKSFGITSLSACEDSDLFSYTWRTFGWPTLAVATTLCWEKAVNERTAALDTEMRGAWAHLQPDLRIENAKHVCATAVLLATVYGAGIRDGSTILRAVTLLFAGIMLTWKRTTLCGCRKHAMKIVRVWLVAIIIAKYCYKSSLFRVMFGTHVFSKDEMLSWLGDFREWAPEYSPRDLLNDIGLVTRPPNFWSASGGAMSDLLPELVALVAIGDLLRVNTKPDAMQTDPVQLLVAKIDEIAEFMAEHPDGRPVVAWCTHHVRVFREDFSQTLRLVCITMVFWMGTYELTLFNFVYFVTGIALTFSWGHDSPTTWCPSVFSDIFGKILPLVHLTSVYVWKLEFWQQVFPDNSDGSIIPLERIETLFGCDANETFTWIGFRGVVMRKVGQQYVPHTSTYAPFVVMISLALYDWLSPGDEDGRGDTEQKLDEEEQKRAEEDSSILSAAAFIMDKYTWLRDKITDQVDLVSGMYLFLLVCFTQSQRQQQSSAGDCKTYPSIILATVGQSLAKCMSCISRYQMGLLSLVLCVRYAVYLGRPPDCDWLSPPGQLITRNSTLRVWFGIANECVADKIYYQPCAVEDLLNDFAILLFMACYTRWTSNTASSDSSIKATEDRVPQYGSSWLDHLHCLFWHSGGVFVLQTVLLYLLVCQWAAANVSQRANHNDGPQAERQGTSVWTCIATWLLLRTFRHEDISDSANCRETVQTRFELLQNDAKRLFRLACGTMFLYAMTQPPLGTKFLEWVHWNFDTICETRVLKALLIFFGVPLQTIELKSASAMNTSYLTMLATTALFALSLKTILRRPMRHKVMLEQYERNEAKIKQLSDKSNLTCNFLWRETMIADNEERTPRGQARKGSTSTVGTVSSWFEHVYTNLHKNWIDEVIHGSDSDSVQKSARAFDTSQTEQEPSLEPEPEPEPELQPELEPLVESRGAKLLAQLILGSLVLVLLSTLGWFIYNWTPLIGSIYFFVTPVVLLLCMSFVAVISYDVYKEKSDNEKKFKDDWISAVIRREPHPECRLDEKDFKWLAEKLGMDPPPKDGFETACTQSSVDTSIDEFLDWYEKHEPDPDARYRIQTKEKGNGKGRLKEKHQRRLVEKLPKFQSFRAQQAQTNILDCLPKFLERPARQFDDLAKSIAFALANFLGIARMCWFVVVGQSLQLCCMMICLGFIEHRDLVSAMLMASLFGYYFDATTNHLARCKFWCSAIDVLQLRMLTAQLVTAVPPFVLVVGCLVWSIFICCRRPSAVPNLLPHFRVTPQDLPPALLIIGLQGLLGALVWPAIILLAITAYFGSVDPHNDDPDNPGTVIFGISVLLFGVSVIGALFFIMVSLGPTVGLWWGAAWVAIVCIAVCATSTCIPTANFSFTDELGKPAMCLAYSLLLASFWFVGEMVLPVILGSQTEDLFSLENMCEQLYQPDGTEWSGHVLDVSVSGWDVALLLVLLLHRQRLRRRGEWSVELNSDLNDLTQRPFSLLPSIEFWDRALIDPLKQHVAARVQKMLLGEKDSIREEVFGMSFHTWTMVSGVLVLAAATLSMMCVFDDIPVGWNENTGGWGSIKWTGQQDVGSCLSTNMTYIIVMAGFMLFFGAVGLLSWAAVTRIELEHSNAMYAYAVIDFHQDFDVVDFAERFFDTGQRCLIVLDKGKKEHWHVHGTWQEAYTQEAHTQAEYEQYPHPARKGEGHSKTRPPVRVTFDKDEKGLQYICKKDAVNVIRKWHITDEQIDRWNVPVDDGYVPVLCWQLVALPLVVALYFERTGQSASQISQSVTQSSTIPTSIVALGCGVFVLIIADRAIYMVESSRCKRLMLWVSMVAYCAFWITSDSRIDAQSDSAEAQSWSVWLMIACSMYFYKSAIQLERELKRNPERRFTRYEKVPGDKNTWVHTFRGPIRKAPFLMELVYLIDWLCTRTALSLACYIRVEEIYTNLYEKQEQMEKEQKAEEEKHSQAVADDQNTRDAAKPFEQAWKASPQNERCRWCCGLVCLVIVLWGPLFAYSSSDILGQRKSARVEGVRVQLDVRALAGDCNRPDPDGCTVDTYTLWSTNSAKLRGITTAADMYGPFQSNVEQSNRATNRIQQQLEETYKYDQLQLLMIGINNASSGWSITSHARSELLNALKKPHCEEGHAKEGCTSLSSRLSYTFSRTNTSKQEDISGHTGWQVVQRGRKKSLHSLVQQISDGYTGRIASVKSIVEYPLYLGLPATGDVRPDIVRSDIAGISLTKAVELSWNYAGLSTICDGNHAAAPPHGPICMAEEMVRNASLGADLGWFTLRSSCPIDNTNFEGLCFILANDKIAAADNEIANTLLASADKLGLVGFYTIAVLWIGNYIRQLVDGEFEDATQHRIHHDLNCARRLMEVCKDLVAARSAPLYDFEEELRIYRTHLASGKRVWNIAQTMEQQATTPATPELDFGPAPLLPEQTSPDSGPGFGELGESVEVEVDVEHPQQPLGEE